MSEDDSQGTYVTASASDCITSIADANGFFWKTIWDHSKNADLKKLRKDPNVLMEGDSVYVPQLQTKNVSKADGQRYTFQRKGVPALTRFRFLKDGKPRANEPYVFTVGDTTQRGNTDGDGMVTMTIPPGAEDGTIVIGSGPDAKTYDVSLGAMDPVATDSGVRKRLHALGYHPRSADDDPDGTYLAQALREFQVSQKLKLTGTLDDTLRSKLSDAFGC